jgi:hypothetical protein
MKISIQIEDATPTEAARIIQGAQQAEAVTATSKIRPGSKLLERVSAKKAPTHTPADALPAGPEDLGACGRCHEHGEKFENCDKCVSPASKDDKRTNKYGIPSSLFETDNYTTGSGIGARRKASPTMRH